MLEWITLVVAMVVVWLWRGSRRVEAERERVKQRLRQLGLDFVDVKRGSSYGFPTYIVVFDSAEESRSFPKSTAFQALLAELQIMHGNVGDATNRFDAARAVGVEPYVS